MDAVKEEVAEVVAFLRDPKRFREIGAKAPRVSKHTSWHRSTRNGGMPLCLCTDPCSAGCPAPVPTAPHACISCAEGLARPLPAVLCVPLALRALWPRVCSSLAPRARARRRWRWPLQRRRACPWWRSVSWTSTRGASWARPRPTSASSSSSRASGCAPRASLPPSPGPPLVSWAGGMQGLLQGQRARQHG